MAVNASERKKRRVTARFIGRVQGVGFRFTTVALASRFDVTGFVRNEPDGSVLIVAEGDEGVLNRFLEAVRSSSVGRYIVKEELAWGPATGEFTRFGVEYGW